MNQNSFQFKENILQFFLATMISGKNYKNFIMGKVQLIRTYALLFIDFLWQQMILIENKFINKVLDNWFK